MIQIPMLFQLAIFIHVPNQLKYINVKNSMSPY